MFLRLILLLATFVAFADHKLHDTTPDLFGWGEEQSDESCNVELARKQAARTTKKIEIMTAFTGFAIGTLPSFHGLLVETKKPDRNSQVAEVNLPPMKKPWKTQIWNFVSEKVRFIDVGFENLAIEAERTNRRILEHIVSHPRHSLKILYDETRSKLTRALFYMRWLIHDGVMDDYMEHMKFLTPKQIEDLIRYNRDSTHNDVLALVTESSKPLEELTDEELKEALLITLQISYFGTRKYLDEPGMKEILAADGFEMDETGDPLPWEYFVAKKYLPEFRKRIYSMFNPKKACEFNRYNRFGLFHPRFQNFFLLNALMRVHRRGMETILAHTVRDGATKMYEDMGFKKIAEIPTDDNPTGELLDDHFKAMGQKRKNVHYLMRLSVGSDRFNDFFNRLATRSEGVTVERE